VGWRAPPAGADPRTGFSDRGRFAVTREEKDLGAFKTPTLREVARRPPYMHDGSVPTLREVVRLYDRGGIRNPWLAPEMKPLGLTPAEVDALVAFMEALGGEGFDDVPPAAFPM
jgi:cytochrome c peroxidase